jgi:hypothetical protein
MLMSYGLIFLTIDFLSIFFIKIAFPLWAYNVYIYLIEGAQAACHNNRE